MHCPITYRERTIKRVINPNATFILVGNRIDGFLDFQFHEFSSFEDVKKNLFDILSKIECNGEWEIKLYQVSKNYKIKRSYGYFKIPYRGKLIYTYSYMDCPIRQIIFDDELITCICIYMTNWENWHAADDEEFYNYNLTIEVEKIKIK